jgi:DNA-nicking Smr family endonuclease
MRFGEILDVWDREQKQKNKDKDKGKGKGKKRGDGSSRAAGEDEFSRQLDRYFETHQEWERFIKEKEEAEVEAEAPPGAHRSMLRSLPPEDSIDLHGMTRDEAWKALDTFFIQSRRRSLRKVLIIHGKGNHSGTRAVLPELVSHYIRHSSYAGESGKAGKEDGGAGATWVILKQGNYRSR